MGACISETANFAPMKWKYLTDSGQLEEINQNSHNLPQIIFKHSTRCVISKMVLNDLEKNWKTPGELADIYLLDLLQYRDVSNYIATYFGIRHESPQLLLIKNGQVIYHESHDSILADEVEKAL